jgi:hypothetical protein
VHAKLGQGRQRCGHQAFAAGLVDGRMRGIRELDAKSGLGRRNRRCQPSRAAADYEEVGIDLRPRHALSPRSDSGYQSTTFRAIDTDGVNKSTAPVSEGVT